MTAALFLTLLGLILLYGGAEGLVRGSSALALRLGLSPLLVGLTVVAFGTSSPELAVSVRAALAGQGDIALGNVVGSNIANVALILGVCALARPLRVDAQVVRWDAPVLFATSALLVVLLGDRVLGRAEGLALCAALVAYLVLSVHLARREPSPGIQEEFAQALPAAPRRLWAEVLLVVAGLGLLVLGGRFLVSGAVTVARGLGLSEAFIGLTVVAVGTSLPELATSLVAALRGEADLAVGNVVGSNIFNVLGVAGLASVIHPMTANALGRFDLWVMLAVAAVALPIVRTGHRVSRGEGALLAVGYFAYVGWLLA
ncbi:MAG: calcium/sodium antiporter [Thermodesulfobacteriota bacterium]